MKIINRRKKEEPTALEVELTDAIYYLSNTDISDEAYDKALRRIERLKALIEDKKPKEGINWAPIITTGLVVITGIIQTVMIIHHEQVGVISTKAMNFILRGRV